MSAAFDRSVARWRPSDSSNLSMLSRDSTVIERPRSSTSVNGVGDLTPSPAACGGARSRFASSIRSTARPSSAARNRLTASIAGSCPYRSSPREPANCPSAATRAARLASKELRDVFAARTSDCRTLSMESRFKTAWTISARVFGTAAMKARISARVSMY